MKYNKDIDSKDEISKEDRDKFMKDPIFIENYSLQKDYDFQTFGFSIGGICISGDLEDDKITDQIEKIHMAYEADVFDDLSYSFVQEAKNLDILSKIYVISAMER
jgi:hypothetical protein